MDVKNKIILGLERISGVFKTLLLDKAKAYGISPIQIQILLFIENHSQELCNVTNLSKEYNLTKPTVSDAVKSLHSKGFVEKDFSSADSRSYSLFLTQEGSEILKNLESYSAPIAKALQAEKADDTEVFYQSLTRLIFRLNQSGVIQTQRTCFGCLFYSGQHDTHFCNLMNKPLLGTDIRLDCAEYQEKSR